MPPRRYRQSIFRILRFLSESTDDRRGGEMGFRRPVRLRTFREDHSLVARREMRAYPMQKRHSGTTSPAASANRSALRERQSRRIAESGILSFISAFRFTERGNFHILFRLTCVRLRTIAVRQGRYLLRGRTANGRLRSEPDDRPFLNDY